MSTIPSHLKYTKDHEWAKIEGGVATIGVTDHAQSALGDVVFVELPKVGRELKTGETFGVVESIKAVSDLYSPLSGKVIAVNEALPNEPSLVNQQPYEGAWMIKLQLSDVKQTAELMDSAAYQAFVDSLA